MWQKNTQISDSDLTIVFFCSHGQGIRRMGRCRNNLNWNREWGKKQNPGRINVSTVALHVETSCCVNWVTDNRFRQTCDKFGSGSTIEFIKRNQSNMFKTNKEESPIQWFCFWGSARTPSINSNGTIQGSPCHFGIKGTMLVSCDAAFSDNCKCLQSPPSLAAVAAEAWIPAITYQPNNCLTTAVDPFSTLV